MTKQSWSQLPFGEKDVDHYYMEVMRRYRHSLPKGKRKRLFTLRHYLLRRRRDLNPTQQLEVIDILCQHRGTILEEGYYLKEDLKALLHSRSRCEIDARYDQILSQWKNSSDESFFALISRQR